MGADKTTRDGGVSAELGGLETLCYPPSAEALRDRFAEVALPALLREHVFRLGEPPDGQAAALARAAYAVADAMLRERAAPVPACPSG